MRIKNIGNFEKLCDERYSLWVKLLNEPPQDVPFTLNRELRNILVLLEIITEKECPIHK